MPREENIPNWWSYHNENGENLLPKKEATTEERKELQEELRDSTHRELYKGRELEKLSDAEFEEYCLWLACEVARCEREERKRGMD